MPPESTRIQDSSPQPACRVTADFKKQPPFPSTTYPSPISDPIQPPWQSEGEEYCMQNFQNTVSPEQFAANRANAANSTGPRTTDGKARSSQNARKHGFAAAAYTVPRLEDVEEVADLRDRAVAFYKPANSQELFAVERIAITEHAMNRAARLEAGTFTTCLNDVLNLRERPLMEMDPDMYGGGEPGREQVKNYLLAEGFRRSVGNSNVIHLCMRYSAQSERLYRRAIEDFDRIRALGPSINASEPPFEPLVDQTNPNPPQPA